MTKFHQEVFDGMSGLTRLPNTGNKWIVTLPEEFGGETAILKTSEVAGMVTTAENGQPDALLIGMERDIDPKITKLLAAMKTNDGVIRYYLLDRMMVIDRLKENHRKWVERKGEDRGNTTRVLYFRDYKLPKLDPQSHVFSEWSKYLIHTASPDAATDEPETQADIVETAKSMIADTYGVTTDCVDINVRLTL